MARLERAEVAEVADGGGVGDGRVRMKIEEGPIKFMQKRFK